LDTACVILENKFFRLLQGVPRLLDNVVVGGLTGIAMQRLGYVFYCCCGILERKRKVGNGADSADESGTHALYAWPRALVVKVWVYDVMGWIGSETGVGSRFWCERAQGLGFVAGVQRLKIRRVCV